MKTTLPLPKPVANPGTAGGYLLQYPDGSYVCHCPHATLASANAAVRRMAEYR